MRRGKHRAARCAMPAISASSRSTPSRVERVQRLVEQPQWRARRSDPGQRRALGLARRQQPHRHVGELRRCPSPPSRGRHCRRPEAQRPPSGSSRSSARRSSASASGGALDLPALSAQQPGGEPDQARLAAAVGAGHLERLARPERRGPALEQQPPAAPQRDRLEPQQRAHPPRPRARACRRR